MALSLNRPTRLVAIPFTLVVALILNAPMSIALTPPPNRPTTSRVDWSQMCLYQQKNLLSLGLVVTAWLSSPIATPAAQTLQVHVDLPALIQLAKDNQEVVKKLAFQASSTVHISGKPDNLLQFVRDAAAGDVWLDVNGLPVDISILSEKGVVSIGLWTEPADLNFEVASQYLPKLPLLLKRIPAVLDEGSAIERQEMFDQAQEPRVSLADQTTFDIFHKGWTDKQVLASTALGLGTSYAASYTYYVNAIQEEERAAELKRQNNTSKKEKTTDTKATTLIQEDVNGRQPPNLADKILKSPEEVANASVLKGSATTKKAIYDINENRKESQALISNISSPNRGDKIEEVTEEVATKTVTETAQNSDKPKKRRTWYKFWFRV